MMGIQSQKWNPWPQVYGVMTRTEEDISIYIVQSGVMTGYANNTIKADVLTQMHLEREAILE